MNQNTEIAKKINRKMATHNGSYNNIYTLIDMISTMSTERNSTFLTLTLKRETVLTDSEIQDCFAEVIGSLCRISGLKLHQISVAGFHLTKNGKGRSAPHFHLLFYSVKDKRSGRSIGKLPEQVKIDLESHWKNLPYGYSLKFKKIFDNIGLLAYLFGSTNHGAKGQKATLLQHNMKLVGRKRLSIINRIISKSN